MKEPAITAALAEELSRAPDFSLSLSAAQLVQLVSMLQLAMRHPQLEDDADSVTQFVRGFIASVRAGFEGFHVVQMVIDKNGGGMDTRPC